MTPPGDDSARTEIERMAKTIVNETLALIDAHVQRPEMKVSYSAIFTKSEDEFERIAGSLGNWGLLANNTPTGPVYVVPPIQTDGGPLRILKVRKPDATRTERGDADFALEDYEALKETVLTMPGFSLISRDEFEMIELTDGRHDARAYFSDPPVEKHAGIREALEQS